MPVKQSDTFTRELHAALARLSNGYTYSASDISEALDAARDADAKLDAVDPARDLRAALEALRRWERAWTAAGSPRTDLGTNNPRLERKDNDQAKQEDNAR